MISSERQIRKIVINGSKYCWKADWFYADGRIIKFRSWLEGFKNTLKVNLFWDSGPPHAVDNSYIYPKEVKQLIEYALSKNWIPNGPAGDFWISEDHQPIEGWKIVIKGPPSVVEKNRLNDT